MLEKQLVEMLIRSAIGSLGSDATTHPTLGGMMTIRSLLIPAAVAGALVTASSLSAQVHSENSGSGRSTTGLIVGANFTGSFVAVDGAHFGGRAFGEGGREGGGGMDFTLGYNFTPTIGVLLHMGGVVLSEDEDRVFGGVDLALRYSFANTAEALVPYLEMAVGGFKLEDERNGEGSELTGGSLAAAVGMNYFVTRRLALNAAFRYNIGMFTTVKVGSRTITDDARIGMSANRVNVGFNWYPMGAR